MSTWDRLLIVMIDWVQPKLSFTLIFKLQVKRLKDYEVVKK